jgi:hypothetical protein
MKDELQRMWKEAVVACLEDITEKFSWKDWEKPRTTSATVDGLRVEI